jgi:hypothetical protein
LSAVFEMGGVLSLIHISLALLSWIVLIFAYLIGKWKLSYAYDVPSQVIYMEWLWRKYVSPTYWLVCLAIHFFVWFFVARLGQYWHWEGGLQVGLALPLPPLMACFTHSMWYVWWIFICVFTKKGQIPIYRFSRAHLRCQDCWGETEIELQLPSFNSL